MNANDKFDFFPGSTANPIGKYTQPKSYEAAPLANQECDVSRLRISAGNVSKRVDNKAATPVKVRGGKAQTKGMYARGPMG